MLFRDVSGPLIPTEPVFHCYGFFHNVNHYQPSLPEERRPHMNEMKGSTQLRGKRGSRIDVSKKGTCRDHQGRSPAERAALI